jgi:hypothetical protein
VPSKTTVAAAAAGAVACPVIASGPLLHFHILQRRTDAILTPLEVSEARTMLSLLLGIPRHLSWTTYARVSSNSRLLPVIQFFVPKAVAVQRWYRAVCITVLLTIKGNS